MFQHIQLQEAGGVVTLTINWPEAANSLGGGTLAEMLAALQELKSRSPLPRALIVTGSGPDFFAVGPGPQEWLAMSPSEAARASELGQSVARELDRFPVPTLAAVNGLAVGGGVEMALACDLIYASENAQFVFIETSVGLLPGFGGTWRLTRRIGETRARFMILAARPITAQTAREWGLLLEVLPAPELLARVGEVAALLAQNAPGATSQAKQVLSLASEMPMEAANALESHAFAACFHGPELRDFMGRLLSQMPDWWPLANNPSPESSD